MTRFVAEGLSATNAMPSREELPTLRVPGLWSFCSDARNSYQFQRVPANRMSRQAPFTAFVAGRQPTGVELHVAAAFPAVTFRQIGSDAGRVPVDDPPPLESLLDGAREFAPVVGDCRLAGDYDRVTRCGRHSADPCVLPNPLVEIVRLSGVSRLWLWRRLAGMQRRICGSVLLLDCAVPATRRTYGDELSRCIP